MAQASNKQAVVVVGAGLAGCMVALLLARRGETVLVLEKRGDWRKTETNNDAKVLLVCCGS